MQQHSGQLLNNFRFGEHVAAEAQSTRYCSTRDAEHFGVGEMSSASEQGACGCTIWIVYSKLQKRVCTSTEMAETSALEEMEMTVEQLQRLMAQLKHPHKKPTVIHCDAQGAMAGT